jgi:heterodisulfide reductase subunit A
MSVDQHGIMGSGEQVISGGSIPPNGKNGSTHSALVIGAGIAGIQAALDIANAGFKVHLVERSPTIGGRMAQLDKTFPTLDCSSCILTPKMAEVPRHPNINLMTCANVVSVEGQAGSFQVTVEQQPRYVDLPSCTGCGACAEACPVIIPSDFNLGLASRKAIYQPFPQAVPSAYIIQKGDSPCQSACPARIPIQGYVALIAEGKFKESLDLIRESGVPFVGTLGRVCYHPCESACQRAEIDEAVSVCGLKRFVYDVANSEDMPEPAEVKWVEKVAIVGAGPAGLTAAYDLARAGYRVTVFDALPVAGGMLVAGIPEYRLPRQVLQNEIDRICALGVDLRLNTPVGNNGGLSLDDLRKEYQAVYLAIGAHGSSRLGVPGEDLSGVLQAVPFLRSLNLGHEEEILTYVKGKRVAVVGGGNTAIDAARSAFRLGGQVQILYRRTRAEMPANSDEIDAAVEEGIDLAILAAPTRVLEQNGKVCGIECLRMALGEPDASGRRRPVPIEGSEFIIELDTVIAAIGQNVITTGLEVELQKGRLAAEIATGMTSQAGVFAGGDAVLGPASVVEAIGAGIQAAETIHRYLRGIDIKSGRKLDWPNPYEVKRQPSYPKPTANRVRSVELEVEERSHNFDEIVHTLEREQAILEAQRCLSCAACSECMQCVDACQRGAIRHDDFLHRKDLQVGTIVVATGYDLFDAKRKPEMGYGVYPQVINTLEFERLASASGPTSGKIVLNGRQPRRIVFIQCVGSRDISLNLPNCSRICCMVVAKQAHLAHERIPGAEITVFYMDIRAFGKGFEEFIDRVKSEGVLYRRGNPSEIYRRGDSVVIRAEDTLLGEGVEVEADLVVLAAGVVPRQDAMDLAKELNVELGEDGYFLEDHPKMRVVESSQPGIYLAGCCQGPKDIPDTVAHAKAAAAAAIVLLARENQPAELVGVV